MSISVASSPAFTAAVLHPSSHDSLSVSATPALSERYELVIQSFSSPPSSEEEIEEAEAKAKVGSRVKVTAPLKVHHVNRVPEVDLEGMEGTLRDYVAVWKGKRISANLPFKIEFFKEVHGRGNVKFVVHLKEDEFIDPYDDDGTTTKD